MFNNVDVVELKECLACGHDNLEMILDLNSQPLANSYKIKREEVQQEFPLAINHCHNCHHVQLTHAVNPNLMFKDYLYVSGTSKTMDNHFKWFAEFSKEYYQSVNNGLSPFNVFDIGCNDGSQLNHFTDLNIKTYGIDPAENLHDISSKRHRIYLGYFDDSFLDLRKEINYDILVAQNVFAHNYDPLGFLRCAKNLMLDSSLLFVQTSQADMIKNNEFDTIYHEHISFYNINSMNELCKRAGLHLIDVVKCPLHGNSYIFIISKKNLRPANIENHIEMERKMGLLEDATYQKYAENCVQIVKNLVNTINEISNDDTLVIGYGAAAKGMTLLNYGKIYMDFIIDDNPLKQGRFTPGMSIPIVSSDILNQIDSKISVLFVPLAWNFFKEIRSNIEKKRHNDLDCFVTYFPKVEIFK